LILEMLESKGLILRRGTIVDASIVESARRPGKDRDSRQHDRDAGYTRRGKRYYYGYKMHVGLDEGSEIIRRVSFTSADVHDMQEIDKLISNDEQAVFGDKGYYDSWTKRSLRGAGIYCGILDRKPRGKELSRRQVKRNRRKSQVWSSVERVFAQLKERYGFRRVRYLNYRRNRLQFFSSV